MKLKKEEYKVNSFARKCDIFGRPLKFFLQNKSLYKSCFGGYASILLIFSVCTIAIVSIIRIYSDSNLSTSIENEYIINPDLTELYTDSFMFAIGFEDPVLLKNNSFFFKIELFQETKQRFNNGTKKIDKKSIELEKCTKNHFKNDEIEKFLLENFLCPKLNSKFIFVGSNQNDVFKSLNIKISKCQKNCADSNTIDNYFKKIENIPLQILFKNVVLESKNKQNPFNNYISNEIEILISPHNNFYKKSEIFFSDIFLNSIKIFFQIFQTSSTIKKFFYNNEKNEQIVFKNQTNDIFAEVIFRKSFFVTNANRTSINIVEIFSFLGGLWTPIFFFFRFFISKYNDFCYLLEIADHLYSIPVKSYEQELRRSRSDSPQRYIKVILNHSQQVSNVKYLFSEFFIKKIRQYYSSVQELVPCWMDFFLWIPSKYFSYRKQIVSAALTEAKKNLNLSNILLKLKEIERLKKLILDDSQTKVLQFFHKPNLFQSTLEKKTRTQSYLKSYRKKYSTPIAVDNFLQFTQLFTLINEISERDDPLQKKLNKKLVIMIYNELAEVLEEKCVSPSFSPSKLSPKIKEKQENNNEEINADNKLDFELHRISFDKISEYEIDEEPKINDVLGMNLKKNNFT